MPSFRYKAKDLKGKLKVGVVESPNRETVNRQLRSMRLKPIYVKVERENFFSRFIYYDKKGNMQITFSSGMPSTRELAIFTKQFAIMIERGVPLIQALHILASQQKSERFGEVIEKIKVMVENGATLSSAMANFPRVFNDLYIAMVRSGELSGNLDIVLLEIVKFLEKAAKLKSQLRSASIYPSIIAFVAASITYGILAFLVPVFAKQYMNAGQDLPAITQFVVDVSNFLTTYILHIFGGIAAVAILFTMYRKTPKGKEKTDDLFLKLPVVGNVLRKIAVSRFSSTMATMLNSGVSILDALEICGASSGNKMIEEFVKNIRDKISQGTTFSDPLGEGDLFPKMVVSMVAVGEQTGALDETLTKVAEIYEEEVDVAIKNMTDMFQPVLIIVIGVILGFVIIALYLPIFDQAALVG